MHKTFIKDHGVGVGLRPNHYSIFKNKKPDSVSWVEVVTENFLGWSFETEEQDRALIAKKNLLEIRKNVPVVLHGVSLNLGSADPLSSLYLNRWKQLIETVEPLWVSDHLCWNGVHGLNNHDLLPLPYTKETAAWVAQKIDHAQNFLKRKILIENVSSYAESAENEMDEVSFLLEVVQQSGCGILLDVNNVFVSQYNHGIDGKKYIQSIHPKHVGQIHIAGHTDKGSYLIDTHDHAVRKEVWSLYEHTIKHCGLVSTMIERDGNIPKWNELEQELLKVHEIRNSTSKTNRMAKSISKFSTQKEKPNLHT